MKRGLIFSLMMGFLFWALSSYAWYPDQEKDGVKDTVSPEEAQRLMKEGTYGMRKDYEPKPGYPWQEDIEKGSLSAEQLMYFEGDSKEEYGFYTRQNARGSLYLNDRNRYAGSGSMSFRYYNYNEGRKIEDGDNYADVLSYHEGKIKAGDVFRISRNFDTYPPLSVGEATLEYFYVKTPAAYKEPDRWKYDPGRRKVNRLGAASKATLRGSGMSTYDDTGGRTVWEHEHKIIGTDVIKPEEHTAGKFGFWADYASTKLKKYITKPIECWVVLSKPREPGYYLGQQIHWIQKSKDHRGIRLVRWEQYDREMKLWKLRERVTSEVPNPEDGDYDELGGNNFDLRRNFRHMSVSIMDLPQVHNIIPWKEHNMTVKQFFSIDLMMQEFRWFKLTPQEHVRKKRWEILKDEMAPPPFLRDRFPQYRKIELRKEVEERIKKLVERGIFE